MCSLPHKSCLTCLRMGSMRGSPPQRGWAVYYILIIHTVIKYCSIVLKVLSFVLLGSKVQYYATKVLCHYDHIQVLVLQVTTACS